MTPTKMFAALLFGLLVIALCILAYKGAVHEFQILQKEYSPDMEWSEILSEELPVVVRHLPRDWLGKWTRAQTEKKAWVVQTRRVEDGKRFRTQWAQWLATPVPRMELANSQEIARVAKLDAAFATWAADGFRRWSWLPTGVPVPYVLDGTGLGLRKLQAEYTALVATDGAPLSLWVAHEGAIPETVASLLQNKDPWIQTTDTIPWIGEVKYIEITLRPGNAVLLPRHWWVAVRAAEGEAWCWIGEFHTAISRVVTAAVGGAAVPFGGAGGVVEEQGA